MFINTRAVVRDERTGGDVPGLERGARSRVVVVLDGPPPAETSDLVGGGTSSSANPTVLPNSGGGSLDFALPKNAREPSGKTILAAQQSSSAMIHMLHTAGSTFFCSREDTGLGEKGGKLLWANNT